MFAYNFNGNQTPSISLSISTITGVMITLLLLLQGLLSTLSSSSTNTNVDFNPITIIQSTITNKTVPVLAKSIIQTVTDINYVLAICESNGEMLEIKPVSDSASIINEFNSLEISTDSNLFTIGNFNQ